MIWLLRVVRNIVAHRHRIWNFQWTAPATDEGTVTFYASGLATGEVVETVETMFTHCLKTFRSFLLRMLPRNGMRVLEA